jgi:hypothetical protein
MTTESESNLNQRRPHHWNEGHLFPFIEACWSNSIACFGNKTLFCQRLSAIDGLFEEIHKDFKPERIEQLVPTFLFVRSFTAYRASVMVASALPTEGYALIRLCLENAGYAHLIAPNSELAEIWFRRDESELSRRAVRQAFTQTAVRESIASRDGRLAEIYQSLYERSIDFGAHPNEKAVTMNLHKESMNTGMIRMSTLPGDGLALDHALRTCAQAGICALKIFQLIFPNQFSSFDGPSRINALSAGL